MSMTYAESWPETVTKVQLMREMQRQYGQAWAEMMVDLQDELGDHDTYDSEVVLGWLGF